MYDHQPGPRAKLFKVRLCDWSIQMVSVVYMLRLQRLRKEHQPLTPLQSLSSNMSVIGIPYSVSVDFKSMQSCGHWRQISRNPTIHGLLSHSSVNRYTWNFPRYRSVPDDSWGMNDLSSSCLSWRWWPSNRLNQGKNETTGQIE
jgi:hypothetical protein